MTEDAKPGYSTDLVDSNKRETDWSGKTDFDIVLEDYGISKLVTLDRDEPTYDDGGFGSFDRDSFDDGSAF